MEIVTKKSEKMREQAFVVYNNIASATTAKRGLTGFNFLGYPLVSLCYIYARCTVLNAFV